MQDAFLGLFRRWDRAEFTSTNAPTTTAQKQQLEQFENDLIADT